MSERRRTPLPRRAALAVGVAVGLPFLAVALAAPAAADWLVTRDGARLETRGPWKVEGKLALFTQPNGTLSSLRLEEVDLDASVAATAEARRKAAEPPPAPAAPPVRKPVLVLTDRDVGHVDETSLEPVAGEGAETAAGVAEAAQRLVVTDWQRVDGPESDGVVLEGTLTNTSLEATANVTLTAYLYDADGQLLVSSDADLSTRALAPQQTASFRVRFPGIYSFATATFEPGGVGLLTAAPGDAQTPEEITIPEEGGQAR